MIRLILTNTLTQMATFLYYTLKYLGECMSSYFDSTYRTIFSFLFFAIYHDDKTSNHPRQTITKKISTTLENLSCLKFWEEKCIVSLFLTCTWLHVSPQNCLHAYKIAIILGVTSIMQISAILREMEMHVRDNCKKCFGVSFSPKGLFLSFTVDPYSEVTV